MSLIKEITVRLTYAPSVPYVVTMYFTYRASGYTPAFAWRLAMQRV